MRLFDTNYFNKRKMIFLGVVIVISFLMYHFPRKVIITLLIFLSLTLVYQYPVQRHLALNKFEWYIKRQGVDKNKIIEKKAYKDWVYGGYVIRVKFEDDMNNRYYYHYEVWTHRAGKKLKFHQMCLSVSDKHRELGPCYEGKCKYPPIEDD